MIQGKSNFSSISFHITANKCITLKAGAWQVAESVHPFGAPNANLFMQGFVFMIVVFVFSIECLFCVILSLNCFRVCLKLLCATVCQQKLVVVVDHSKQDYRKVTLLVVVLGLSALIVTYFLSMARHQWWYFHLAHNLPATRRHPSSVLRVYINSPRYSSTQCHVSSAGRTLIWCCGGGGVC